MREGIGEGQRPGQELERALGVLVATLTPRGVLASLRVLAGAPGIRAQHGPERVVEDRQSQAGQVEAELIERRALKEQVMLSMPSPTV